MRGLGWTCRVVVAACGVVFGAAAVSAAQTGQAPRAEEAAQLRRELSALKEDYERRLAAVEARLAALEAGGRAEAAATAPEVPVAATPPPAETPAAPPASASTPPGSTPPAAAPSGALNPPATAQSPPGAAAEGGPTALPVYGAGASSSKVFNPDIAVIGDFIGAVGRTPGGGEPSLEMHEAELSFQAVVDPYARADFFLTAGPDEVGIEEAVLTFPTAPAGLLLKVGKMRDAFGKVNGLHNHTLPFIDRPLMNRNLLGGEDALADSGISVARLIPNPWLFLEATAQVFRGQSEVFAAPRRRDLAWVGHLRAYRDLGESTNLDLGGSVAYGHNAAGFDQNGALLDPRAGTFTTRLLGVDATLRWRPLRRSIYTRVLARSELTWSRREQPDGVANAFGGYGSLEYQFARRWFAGLRLDTAERADAPGLRDRGGSLLLTFWPSEFSQIRTQLRRTRLGEGRTDNELLFQFLFAIGAHGAHAF